MALENEVGPLGVDNKELEQYMQNQAALEQQGKGNARIEVVRSSIRPETITNTVRDMLNDYEDPYSGEFHDRYSLAYAFRILEDRGWAMGKTNEELDTGGIKEDKLPGFAIRVEDKEEVIIEHNPVKRVDFDENDNPTNIVNYVETHERKVVRRKLEYGTNEERKALSEVLIGASKEIEVRWKIHELYQAYMAAAADLGKLTELYYIPLTRLPLTSDYARLFRLQDASEIKEGREGMSGFGDRIDRAMRLFVAVGMCEDPAALRKLMRTSGWKVLFGSDSEKEQEMMGAVQSWNINRPHANFYEEDRGSLTKFGNIFNRVETDHERETIKNTIAELVGDVGAMEIAWKIFHEWGMASEFGGSAHSYKEVGAAATEESRRFRSTTRTEAVPAGKYEKAPSLEGHPSADDLIKIFHFSLWQKKQSGPGHPGGPNKETRGQYGDLVVSFLRYTAAYMNRNANGSAEEESYRSMWELWWNGYGPGDAMKLGELPWNSDTARIPLGATDNYLLRIFIAARKDKGLFEILTKYQWAPQELMSTKFWEEFNKWINICIGPHTITKGEYEGKNTETIERQVKELKKKIKKLFWETVEESLENSGWLSGKAPGSTYTNKTLIKDFQKKAGYVYK